MAVIYFIKLMIIILVFVIGLLQIPIEVSVDVVSLLNITLGFGVIEFMDKIRDTGGLGILGVETFRLLDCVIQ